MIEVACWKIVWAILGAMLTALALRHLDMIEDMGMKEFMNYFKKELIQEFVNRNNGSIRQAAKKIGIAPSTISELMSDK